MGRGAGGYQAQRLLLCESQSLLFPNFEVEGEDLLRLSRVVRLYAQQHAIHAHHWLFERYHYITRLARLYRRRTGDRGYPSGAICWVYRLWLNAADLKWRAAGVGEREVIGHRFATADLAEVVRLLLESELRAVAARAAGRVCTRRG